MLALGSGQATVGTTQLGEVALTVAPAYWLTLERLHNRDEITRFQRCTSDEAAVYVGLAE
jgi:hypothetical protein